MKDRNVDVYFFRPGLKHRIADELFWLFVVLFVLVAVLHLRPHLRLPLHGYPYKESASICFDLPYLVRKGTLANLHISRIGGRGRYHGGEDA